MINTNKKRETIQTTNMKIKIVATMLLAAAGLLFTPALRAGDNAALMEPAKSVLDHYLKIQAALAGDSLTGVSADADAIAKAVQGDSMKMLPGTVASEAESLAKASNLESARSAFKPLSNSLIKYLADNKVPAGTYHQAYCSMARASWLQSGTDIKNPYLGKAMLTCGVLKD